MRNLLIGIILISFLAACNFSKQNRAEAAITELMKAELEAERAYEPIEFGDLQTITYSTYLQDYIEQKKIELDSLEKRIKKYESEHELKIDTLMLSTIQLFGGINEGRKLLKDRELLRQQIEEKKTELEANSKDQKEENYSRDSLYLVYHTYKLSGKTDTAKQVKRKNFILSMRYRIIDVYTNHKPDPFLITREKKFDLD